MKCAAAGVEMDDYNDCCNGRLMLYGDPQVQLRVGGPVGWMRGHSASRPTDRRKPHWLNVQQHSNLPAHLYRVYRQYVSRLRGSPSVWCSLCQYTCWWLLSTVNASDSVSLLEMCALPRISHGDVHTRIAHDDTHIHVMARTYKHTQVNTNYFCYFVVPCRTYID